MSNVFVHHDEHAHIAQCRGGVGSPATPSTGFLTLDPSQVVYSLLTYRIVSATWGPEFAALCSLSRTEYGPSLIRSVVIT